MKKLLLGICMLAGFTALGQNALLKNATTGDLTNTSFADLCIVSDGNDVVLLAAGTYSVYAIDIADNDPADAANNLITSVPNFVSGKLDPLAGQSVTVLDMVVNPVSKAVYILGSAGTNRIIFKAENAGADVTILDMSNVTYSDIAWGSSFGLNINDMAYADNTLYVSSGTFSLDGALGWVAAPFTHNSTFSKRSTTLFKSNWGGNYYTTAPLETLTIGEVDGKSRLMGVTTCAPGFSIDVSTLSGSGLLSVTEDFNIHRGQSKKAVFQHHDGKDWLFDLHDGKLYRIGKKYLDGSQVSANQHNNNSILLRDNSGNVISSLPEEDIKQMSSTDYSMIAFYDNWTLLLLESGANGSLMRSKMSAENPAGIAGVRNEKQFKLYPNPAGDNITIDIPGNKNATVAITDMSGSVIHTTNISNRSTIDVSSIPSGIYTITVQPEDGAATTKKLTIK